jgi:type I restriction enzyme S subunit
LRTNETRLAGKGTGSTFSAISGDDLRALDVTLPSLPEQRRIVARIEELFSKLDAGVEELKKAKAQLKRYRQSVLKAAFSGELTSEWRKRRATSHEPIETAAMLLERIKAERRKMQGEKHKDLPLDMSELPALPKLWSWAKLGQVATVVRGASPRPKGDPKYFGGTIPWIMISDITREKGKSISKTKDTVTDAGATKSRLLKAGTLILSNSGTVCVPKFLAVDGCIHDGFVAFLDIPVAINQLYLFHFFNYVRPRITNENRQGVTQVNLNTTIVNNMVFPLSPLEEQEAIAESVEAALSVAENAEGTLDAGLKQAARLRQAILKRAFEGKLVPQDPSDEPAEKLLERIRAEKEERVAGAKRKREAAVGRTRRRRQT